MKQKRWFVIILAFTVIATAPAFSRQVEPDTLYYFDPGNIDLNPIYTGDIDSAGIFFTPDSRWNRYDILELHFLFIPGLIDTTVPSPFEGEVLIRSGETADRPGKVLVEVPIQIAEAQETYPNWKKISLLDLPEVRNIQGNFWLEGTPLLACVRSSSRSNHSFLHSAHTMAWNTTFDIFVRAIVKEQRSVGVNAKAVEGNNTIKLVIQNFPNPFNASTVIGVNNMAAAAPATIIVYDVRGRHIATLFEGILETGNHRFQWKGTDGRGAEVSSGIYFCHTQWGRFKFYKKLVLIR